MPSPDSGSHCPIAGCKRSRAPGMLMCATCWHRVPEDVQREVYAAWRQRQDGVREGGERYHAAETRHEAAKKAAIEAVEGSKTSEDLPYAPAFVAAHEAYYRRAFDTPRFYIGLYGPGGGTPGDFSMVWHDLGGGGITPRLQVFNDGWAALAQIDREHGLLAALAALNNTDPTPDQIKAMLISIGLQTPRSDPEEL